jgi:hypothetical protein
MAQANLHLLRALRGQIAGQPPSNSDWSLFPPQPVYPLPCWAPVVARRPQLQSSFSGTYAQLKVGASQEKYACKA